MVTQKTTTWIIFLLFFFFFPALNKSQVLPRLDNTTDQLSLLSFKTQIDPSGGVLDTWNTNSSFCSWRGVACDNTNQRVTNLTLENLNLAGSISPYIANLSYLTHLNLYNNSISGVIPHELGQLNRLRNLTLSYNLIQGTIPSSLSLCTRLVTIDLLKNRIEGSIPYELGGLSELQILRLRTNNLTGQIPPSLGNLSSMTNLILSDNILDGPIPEDLGRLPRLVHLQIHENNLTGEIPPSIFNSSLALLSLALNNLSGSLPFDMFTRLTNLTTFYAAGNNLTGLIPSSLANASKLQGLDLAGNNFHGPIPLLSNMPNIQILILGDNQLASDGEVGMEFISSLSNSPKLQVFAVNSNKLTGKLPRSIGNLSKVLSQLYMGNNHFEGTIPAEISELAGLTLLSLEMNSFTGTIPSSIGMMPILQRLSLSGNKLTANTGIAWKSHQLRLQILDLSVNMLNGTIPREIVNIPNLSNLLNLSSNSLTGSLPTDIGKLTVVQDIDVSKNHLFGEIPVSIGKCSSLTFLDLSKNSFQGPIPNSLGDLGSLAYINLSSNELSGTIPPLRFSGDMQVLDLSRNRLEGDVPKEGVFLNSSVISLDGNANLCGGMPVLKLPECVIHEKNSGGSKIKLIIGIVVGSAAFIIFSCVLLLFLWKRNKSRPKVTDNIISFEGPHRLYTYHDLRIATGNFNEENLIGEGSFGRVYKGILRDGTPAAIKVFDLEQHGALKSFLAECEALRNVRHRNLIRIMSACSSSEFKALVLQFMPNGSLDQWLYKNNGSWLEFDTRHRLDVAKDVASALEYLHHDCETQVVHCDLKPSNVLLDENMTAYVGDFGLARKLFEVSKEGPLSSTIGLKGSIGYMPPEYGLGGGVSPKGDVYSYGIVLLEMFTGKKPTDTMFTEELDLHKWVAMALPDFVMDIIDPELVNEDEFDLSRNNFNGQIPLLGNMPNIWFINLAENQLTSDGPGGMEFLASLANSAKLQVFAVSTNRLKGKLLPFIGNLSKELSQLYMGDNQLQGSLPAEISKLVGLTMLSLEINSFTGNIPPSIGELPRLQRLRLDQNKFSGDIPGSYGNLAQLYEMTLTQNNLTGTIPARLGNLQRLQLVDLSANML
ncbi:hypothetical protein AQUCO_00900905v1 [Aquilegia coerulea]|uniref:non-specific serine/threonine protein kinase n=1 Tax=Aquilegia coerulea TaxID=218851 RepID=A0A2G5EFW2_AQUCA|nr:hypothetical protein AQUCO_00900905v1 [Aquilegia coerulea]